MRRKLELLAGENPIKNAPVLTLDNNQQCIPQHFLNFTHTLDSVESIILDIGYSERFPIFVSQDNGQLILQVGVVGQDNYTANLDPNNLKIVYGRKWRIEPNLPTSEIIQTAFLAIQKAREHEIRELLRLALTSGVTTPFNNHHDLPLLSRQRERLDAQPSIPGLAPEKLVTLWLAALRYDHAQINLLRIEMRDTGQWIIDIQILPSHRTQLPEITQQPVITLLLEDLDKNALYHGLMDNLLMLSNRHVEQHFTYKGFNRFARHHSLMEVAGLSIETRLKTKRLYHENFAADVEATNYATDMTRVPKLSDSRLGRKLRMQLSNLNIQDGILPD